MNRRIPSPEEIEAARTERGGWTREALEGWGVQWPPPFGWRDELDKEYRQQREIDDYNALPPKEQLKAWDSLKRLEDSGEIEPITPRLEKPKAP